MVFAEAAWLRPLRWGLPFSKESPRQKGNSADDCHAWAAFDAADAMERGLVGPATSPEEDRLVKAPHRERRLTVRVLKNGAEHRLVDDSGELLLVAKHRHSSDQRIDIYLASAGTDGPASFVLTFDEDRTEFRLARVETNESCESKGRELLRIAQTGEEIGDGACMYLDVTVHDVDVGATMQLGSKRPVWNEKLQSLTMDFGGRCSKASQRNFQLGPMGNEDDSLMFFGKIARNTFNLDYAKPLGALHAFAVAISTQHWENGLFRPEGEWNSVDQTQKWTKDDHLAHQDS